MLLSKYTIIGMIVGGTFIALGLYSLVYSFSNPVISYEKTVLLGESRFFSFDAKAHYHEILNVTGNSFHVKLQTPSTGLQVDEDFKKEISFDWYSLVDGEHKINVTNTGDSEVKIIGKLQAVNSLLDFPFHMLLIISGIIIIGVSAGFTIRKPRGF